MGKKSSERRGNRLDVVANQNPLGKNRRRRLGGKKRRLSLSSKKGGRVAHPHGHKKGPEGEKDRRERQNVPFFKKSRGKEKRIAARRILCWEKEKELLRGGR